jgi:outer membrane protein
MRGARSWVVAAVLLTMAAPGIANDVPGHEPTYWGATKLLRQWRPGIPPSPAVAVPAPITRDERVQPVTLSEAIALALANNPGIAAQRLEPLRQEEAILEAQGQYDPTLAGEVMQSHSRTPNASSLAGTRTLRVDDRTANLHLVKQFRTGTLATVDFLNERLDNNARFNQLRPEYVPRLNLSIVQPLLRNFGWDYSYLVVRVAEETAEGAYWSYQAQLADFVTTVITAYWNVVRARDQLAVQRASLALATRTVEENQARVKVGLLPPVAMLEAQADAKAREEQVLIADNDLAVARQQLAQLCFFRPDGTFVPRTLEPTDELAPEPLDIDLDETLTAAIAGRPEVLASTHGVAARALDEKIAGNGLLPRLDLVGSYGVNGLSGTNRPLVTTTPVPGGNCVANGAQPGTFVCNSPFGGPASDAYDRLSTNDFRTYSFGVQFQVPLSNAIARSQYARSRIARDQAELNHRELLSQVTLEARRTVSDVLTTRQRIDTSRVARELAEENLRNQEKRHEVGIATTKDLLDFQTRVTTARAAEVQAKVEHALAVARWRRAQGALLRGYRIVVEQPGRRATPWFARF